MSRKLLPLVALALTLTGCPDSKPAAPAAGAAEPDAASGGAPATATQSDPSQPFANGALPPQAAKAKKNMDAALNRSVEAEERKAEPTGSE